MLRSDKSIAVYQAGKGKLAEREKMTINYYVQKKSKENRWVDWAFESNKKRAISEAIKLLLDGYKSQVKRWDGKTISLN